MTKHPDMKPEETFELSKLSLAKWVVDTCLLFGASVATAYNVAGLFVEGLEATSDALPE